MVSIENPEKNNTEHPAISGQLWQSVRSRNKGPVADIDYDLEPYRVIPGGYKGATKSKPADDLEAARWLQEKTEERTILF